MAQMNLASHSMRYTALPALLCLLAAACGPQTSPVSPSGTEIGRVTAGTATPLAPSQPPPTDTTLRATDVPAPTHTATVTSKPTPLPVPTQGPTVEPAERRTVRTVTTDDSALLEAEIAAIEAAIAQEPWRFEHYHYLHSARLEQAARRPLDELDAKIAEYDELLANDSEDAALYVMRAQAKYHRTFLSGEPAYSEDLLSGKENLTVIGAPVVSYHLVLEDAIADLNRAIALDPESPEAFHMRGLAYHLQGLEYIGIAQLGVRSADIDQALHDYGRALALDPDMALAYRDRGTAYTHRGWHLGREADDTRAQVFEDLSQAVQDLTAAIDRDPDSESTYLNRALTNWLLSAYLQDDGLDPEDNLQQWLDDSSRVVESDPQNMWGYLLRALAYASLMESEEDESAAAQLETRADDDFEAFQDLGDVLLQEYEISDLFSRILTLSSGPPIDPRGALPGLLGTLEDDVYTSPDGRFRLQAPDLMQPNAIIWDEMASSGDLLVWFEDDLSRWYALQAHPGTLAQQSLEEWVGASLAVHFDVQEQSQENTPLGPAMILLHRYAEPEADCCTAVVHHDEQFYAATYCLLDHYPGEEDGAGIRTFGEMYGIDIEPVDALAEEFIGGLEFLSEE